MSPKKKGETNAASASRYPNEITKLPAMINNPPSTTFKLSASPKKTTPRMMANATLNLSTGVTTEAGASCSARN